MAGSYNEHETQEILRRAAAVQSTGFMSRDELLRAAAELGITPEAVLEAEEQYEEARAQEDLLSRYRAKRKSEFFESLKGLLFFGVVGTFVINSYHQWFWIAVVVVAMSVANVLKEGSRYFWQSGAHDKGFREFKEKEGRRKSLADRRANDRVIADILLQTSAAQKVEVIKNLRDLTGLALTEAKAAVDDYYGRHPDITQRVKS